MSQEREKIGRFFKHSYIYAIGNIINRIGAFILLPVYTNYLTPDEYGVLELLYAVSMVVVTFLSAGLAHATLRFYFEYDKNSDRKSVITTNLIASFILACVGGWIITLWEERISLLVFSSIEYVPSIRLILATIVFELSSQICLAYIRAIEKSKLFVYVAISKLIIQVILNIYFVIYASEGVYGILKGNLSAVIIGWLVLVIYTLKGCGIQFELSKLKEILKYSLPFVLGTFTAMIAANADKFSLNHFETLGIVGIYMLAYKFGMLLEQLIGEPFSRSYGSFRFSIMKDKNAAKIQSNIVRYLVCGTTFVALGICLFMNDLLYFISDASFWPAAMVLPIIMLASIVRIMNYPVQTGILYAKKTKYFFYFGVVTAVVSVIANYFLVRIWGMYGAAMALVITNISSLLLMHYKSQKYFKVSYDLMKISNALVIGICLYLLSLLTYDINMPIAIFVKVLLFFSFLYFVFYTNLLLKDDEKIFAFDFVNKKIRRFVT